MMGWPATSKRGFKEFVRKWFAFQDIYKFSPLANPETMAEIEFL